MSNAPSDSTSGPRGLILLPHKNPDAGGRVWGLTSLERLERGLTRLGVDEIETLTPDQAPPRGSGPDWIVVRGDLFYDERLLQGLCDRRDVALWDEIPGSDAVQFLAAHVSAQDLDALVEEAEGGVASTGAPGAPEGEPRFARVAKLDLAPAYNPTLRKFDPPFVFDNRASTARATENHIFRASYKGITDFVTKWVWPLPAREVTRVLAQRGVQPNTVTAVSYVLTILATWFFAEGWFVAGLVAGWGMTFLDTVDGKLARCTLTSSKIGNVLDHGLDLVHPPIWWTAWAWGLPSGLAGWEIPTAIVVVGYVTGRLLEGVFLLFFKQELFTWRPFDAFFRTIIARRNPNLVLLSVAVAYGRPDLGFLAVAGWTVVGNVVPLVRILQAFGERRRGGVIQSWYEAEAQETAATNERASA
jgi:phosphatidylglycerophosphate synthase